MNKEAARVASTVIGISIAVPAAVIGLLWLLTLSGLSVMHLFLIFMVLLMVGGWVLIYAYECRRRR
jgi:hypothetical protein